MTGIYHLINAITFTWNNIFRLGIYEYIFIHIYQYICINIYIYIYMYINDLLNWKHIQLFCWTFKVKCRSLEFVVPQGPTSLDIHTEKSFRKSVLGYTPIRIPIGFESIGKINKILKRFLCVYAIFFFC